MNRKELKLYISDRLKNRIDMLAQERRVSKNKLCNYLLEIGLYKLLEEESEYGKSNFNNKRKVSDNNGISAYNNKS